MSNHILKADRLSRFRLQHLLRGFGDQQPRLISAVPTNILLNWCEQNEDQAPKFLAAIARPVELTNNIPSWTQLVHAIIDKYGNKEGVLEKLSANMGTFVGWGSSLPHYEQYLGPLDQLLSHRLARVREWASKQLEWYRQIMAEEKKREEEEEFGILR